MPEPAAPGILVGRERELTLVDDALTGVAGGAPAALVLVGDAGIGKSALLDAARRRAHDAGMRVLHGRAAEHERDVPFGLVIDALDDLVAELHERRLETIGPERLADLACVLPAAARHAEAAPTGPAAGERFRYHRALASLLELVTGERPVVLLLDDLHWADEGSVEFLVHLLRRPPRGPLLLIGATRPVDPAPRVLDALRATGGGQLVELGPLDRTASLELLAGVPDPATRDRLAQEAQGNPLFLRELARTAPGPTGSLPATVLAAVQLEAAQLPPAARTLLEGAAIAGDPFELDLAVSAAGMDGDEALDPLDRLVAADLVRLLHGRRFAFRHPLVRRAVEQGASPGWRLAAHERVAAALAQRGAPATARAYHVEQYAQSGDQEALAVLSEAAGTAFDRAPAAAAHWYEAALALVPPDDAAARAALLGPRALALAAAGRLDQSRSAILETLRLLGDHAPMDLRVILVAGCAEVEQVLGRHREALERLLALHDDLPESSTGRLRLEVQIATTLTWMLEPVQVGGWAARAVASAGDERSALAVAALAAASSAAAWAGDGGSARDWAARGQEMLQRLDDAELALYPEAAMMLAGALLFLEQLDGVAAAAERGLGVSRTFGQSRLLVPLQVLAATACWHRARITEALERLGTAEEAARLQRADYLLCWVRWVQAMVFATAGATLDSSRAAAEARALAERLEPSVITCSGLCNIAAFAPGLSGPERVSLAVGAGAGGGDALPRVEPTWSTAIMRALCVAELQADQPESARAWAERAADVAGRLDLPLPAVRAAGARVEMLLADEQPDAAAGVALRCVEDAEAGEAPLETLIARARAGRALGAARRRDEAVAMLQLTVEQAGRAGAGAIREDAARELRRLGSRPSAASERGAIAGERLGDLTPREAEIAELVAQGMSNKQVAAAVFLSEKTVEHHLSRIYAKLGVTSRTQLAGVLSGG